VGDNKHSADATQQTQPKGKDKDGRPGDVMDVLGLLASSLILGLDHPSSVTGHTYLSFGRLAFWSPIQNTCPHPHPSMSCHPHWLASVDDGGSRALAGRCGVGGWLGTGVVVELLVVRAQASACVIRVPARSRKQAPNGHRQSDARGISKREAG
jgi:hypothetical protein